MSILKKSTRLNDEAFFENFHAELFGSSKNLENCREENISLFESKLVQLLPLIGGNEDTIIQIEVLIALSVEGILTIDNLGEKAPMVKAICEMIKFDSEKKSTAIEVAKRLLNR